MAPLFLNLSTTNWLVNDFVVHVDGRAEFIQRQVQRIDCHVHAGTKSAGRGQNIFIRLVAIIWTIEIRPADSVASRRSARVMSGWRVLVTVQNNREGVFRLTEIFPISATPRSPTPELQCRRLAKSHYENFVVASVLLPPPATAVLQRVCVLPHR